MKKIALLLLMSISTLCGKAQEFQYAKAEDEIKNKLEEEPQIIAATPRAVYTLLQAYDHVTMNKKTKMSRYIYKAKLQVSDTNMIKKSIVDVKPMLEGHFFYDMVMIDDEVYVLSTNDYYKEGRLDLYALSFDGLTGKIHHPLKQLASYSLPDNYYVQLQLDTVKSGKGIFVMTNFVKDFDFQIHTVIAKDGFDHLVKGDINFPEMPRACKLNHVYVTPADNIMVAMSREWSGKLFVDNDFPFPCAQLQLQTYNPAGKLLNDVLLEVPTNFILNHGIQFMPDGAVTVTGMWTDNKAAVNYSGYFVQHLKADGEKDGEMLVKEMSTEEIITKLPRSMKPVAASSSKRSESTQLNRTGNVKFIRSYYDPNEGSRTLLFEEVFVGGSFDGLPIVYHDGLIMMKFSRSDELEWIDLVRKQQRDVQIEVSSVGSAVRDGKLILLMNDFTDIRDNIPYTGVKVDVMDNFKKTSLFALVTDLKTGEIARRPLHERSGEYLAAPVTARYNGGSFYMLARYTGALSNCQMLRVSVR